MTTERDTHGMTQKQESSGKVRRPRGNAGVPASGAQASVEAVAVSDVVAPEGVVSEVTAQAMPETPMPDMPPAVEAAVPAMDMPPVLEASTPDVEKAAVLDAPATEPTDAPATPEAEASPPSPPVAASPARSSSSLLVPGLIGLVAGAIGGIAVAQFGGVLRLPLSPGAPAMGTPPALVARVEKLEGLLVEAGKSQSLLREEFGRITADVAAQKKAVEGVSSSSAPLDQNKGADLEGLKSRLGALEALQSRLDTLAKDVQAMSGQVAKGSGRDALAAAQARLAALSLLEDAAGSGRPLVAPLDLLRGLGIEATRLAPFAPFEAEGLPDAKRLLEALKALAPPPASPAPAAAQGLFDRLRQGAVSLVDVRKKADAADRTGMGDSAGSDDAARLARAAQGLNRGDIALALAEVSRLSGEAATPYAPWRERAEARARALDALGRLKNEALTDLVRAAPATP
jgi:hypothetical protein